MAKSKESFNKKEKEKKKLKKKQEKVEKKEMRKASGGKNSYEDMIAYVDENGNITSTPPDPSKKREVNQDNIQISISRRSAEEDMQTARKGTVSFFNESKAYGFIIDDISKENIFVHKNGLIDPIRDKDKVTFEVENTPKGKSAIDVKLVPKTK